MNSSRNGSAPNLGFRRVEVVEIIVEDAGARAEVTGVVHRLPHTVRVPLHTARALIANGTPSRFVDVRTSDDLQTCEVRLVDGRSATEQRQ